MTEHTPGKWRACLRPSPNHGHVLAEDWSVIAVCPCNIGPIGTGEANTQLIANAPRLLDRCRVAEQTLRNLGAGFLTGNAAQIALNEAANLRAAIAAATATEADSILEANRRLLRGDDVDWSERI